MPTQPTVPSILVGIPIRLYKYILNFFSIKTPTEGCEKNTAAEKWLLNNCFNAKLQSLILPRQLTARYCARYKFLYCIVL